jgi:FixJ family two-component response regulator
MVSASLAGAAALPEAAPIIYVVDDDEAVRDSLGLLLESHGLASEVFESAEDFLKSYRRGGRGCLILDVRMPGMSGVELLETLAKSGFELPVIVMSGHADAALAARAGRAGARGVIDKPFRDQHLVAAIRDALASRAV